MSRKKIFTILILTYNSEKHIHKTISSIHKYLYGVNYNILVVDNASYDNTVEQIRSMKSDITLKVRDKNYGFGRSINWGANYAKGDYLFILNPDTELKDYSLRRLLLSNLVNENNILAPITVRADGSLHGSYVRKPNANVIVFDFTNFKKIFPDNKWHKYFYYGDTKLKEINEVEAVSGAAMIISKKKFIELGGFDNNFFMYLEDIDFCNRARSAGLKILLSKEASIYHEAGGSSSNTEKTNLNAWINSRNYYVDKYFSGPVWLLLKVILLIDSYVIKYLSFAKNENLLSKRRVS